MMHRSYAVAVVTLSAWTCVCQISDAQTVVALQNGSASQANVAVDRDPEDPRERFVLFVPGGPLVVEFSVSINGRPFRSAREKLVDELFDQLVKEGETSVTWEHAVETPRSPLRQFYLRGGNAAAYGQLVKQFDANQNGLVDRTELRQVVGRNYGDAFTARGNPVGVAGAVVLDDLLDTDHDRVLSRAEIAAAAERLKSRDEDDNDLISLAEAGGQAPGIYRVANLAGNRQPAGLVMLLGPAADLQAVFKAFQEKYQDGDGKLRAAGFPLLPKLVETLDRNDNGEFDRDEVAGLNSLAPHLACEINLGASDKLPQGLTVKSLAPELGRIEAAVSRSADVVTIKASSLTLSVTVNSAVSTSNFETQARFFFDRYDTDKNGYLDKEEVAGQQGLAQQFELWDSDGDGKVYAKEIIAASERQIAPSLSQVNVLVSDQGTALFSALDLSGDRRLGLREIRTAAERLKTFDSDGDGQITGGEIPRQFAVTVGRGNINSFPGGSTAIASGSYGASPVAQTKTNWFSSMDRNGDGDVSQREFLGNSEQFQKLDADGDGLIDRAEANTAKDQP